MKDLFDLQYDLKDVLGGQSHKSKIFVKMLVEQLVTFKLLSWESRNTYYYDEVSERKAYFVKKKPEIMKIKESTQIL